MGVEAVRPIGWTSRPGCRWLLALVVSLAAGAPLPTHARAQSPRTVAIPERPAVLILNSYHSGYSWSDNEIAGILDVFRQQDKYWIPFVEFLDTKNFPGKEHFASLKEVYRQKYRNARITMVIACDNPALEFILENRKELAPEASVVFCGVNGYNPGMIADADRITGIAENLDIEGTLEVALSLRPGTKTVVAMHDFTVSGLGTRRLFDAVAPRFADRVRFDILPDLPMSEILQRVSELPADAIVLALSYSRDRNGQVFDLTKFADLLSRRSAAPVFVVHEERLGRGIVGGSLLGGAEHGKLAATIALRVLSGVPASAIPVLTKPQAQLMFDWEGLARFGISPSSLPAGSIVINEPQSFFFRYKRLVWSTVGVMTALVLLVFGLAVNVLRRRRAEKALETQRAFLQSVIDGLPDPVFVLDPDHSVRMRNRSAEVLERPSPDDLSVPPPRPLLHPPSTPCAADGERCPVREVVDFRQPVHFERRRLGSGNKRETYEISAAPLWQQGAVAGIIASAHDITELKSVYERLLDHERQLEHIAHHDPLTGLPNRLLFLDRFHQAIARSQRSHNTVALLFLDLDRFKNVNDTLGHETGDRLLRLIADRLKASVRVEDTVARLGGDEFTVLIEESHENPTGVVVARKIIQALESPFSVGPHQLYAGASIGIAIFPADGTTVEKLIRNADAAMYLAKERGRGNYQFFTESLNAKAHRLLLLETRLRDTLSRGGLDLHFQPIVRLRDGRIVAAEALLRWTDAELGTVTPDEFIPVAEETGLIISIGESVLKKACLAASHWHAIGFPEVRVAVNISARQFWHQDLASSVRQALEESGLPPPFLEMELTESLLLPDNDSAVEILRALRRLGIRLSLDDFGTGYSSLGYLKRLPLDNLKVAQSFVKDISVNPNDAAIVRAILSLSKTLGFEVTAEGVETQQHVDFFQTYGCDLAQGHFFSPALPVAAFEEFLRAHGDTKEETA